MTTIFECHTCGKIFKCSFKCDVEEEYPYCLCNSCTKKSYRCKCELITDKKEVCLFHLFKPSKQRYHL